MQKRYVAKVFRTGGSQAIRIPKECQMPGDEVVIIKEDGRLSIEPINKRGWSREFLEMISTPAPADLLRRPEQPKAQDRDFDL